MNEKVYIIAYDLLSPISFGKENLYQNLKNNVAGEAVVQSFETEGMPFNIAAEVKEDLAFLYENEKTFIKQVCAYDRKFELAVALANKVEKNFTSIIAKADPKRRGIVMGVGSDVIKVEQFEDIKRFANKTSSSFNELIIEESNKIEHMGLFNPYDIHALYFAEKFDLRAFQKSTLTACTSSTQAIAFAFDSIKRNQADIVFAGGTDSIINTLALIAFGKLGVITESNKKAKNTCQPFDQNRKGTLAGEAAGIAILASESFVKKNNITPIAEILSYGNTLDAYKITAPDPSGVSMEKAITQALANAKIAPKEIDYINAHGTGTKQNDAVELNAIFETFGNCAKKIPISSTKDRHGHAIAAAGVQELAVLLACMQNDFIPANTNLKKPIDASFNLLKENQTKKINYAMSNNFAFGGVNTVFILKNTNIKE